MRFTIRNTTHGRKQARLWIVVPDEQVRTAVIGDEEEYTIVGEGRIVPADPVGRQWRVERLRATGPAVHHPHGGARRAR